MVRENKFTNGKQERENFKLINGTVLDFRTDETLLSKHYLSLGVGSVNGSNFARPFIFSLGLDNDSPVNSSLYLNYNITDSYFYKNAYNMGLN